MSNEMQQMIETIKKEINEEGIIYEVQGDVHVLSVAGAPWITEHAKDLESAIKAMAEYALRPDGRNIFADWVGEYFIN